MSNWSSTQLTDLGRALDAKVTAGATLLSFTKMKLGSGTETAEDIPAMTDLVSPKLVLGISSCAVSASDDTICELISVASSSDVEESFVVRELGVFATDPDVGEILYAVMLDSTPDTMPNENVSSPVTVTYQVNIVSANASSITAVIDPTGLVTASVLQAHNDSISAHKMAHWYRQNSKVYAVGDIAFSASLPSSLVLECTTAGTTAAAEPDFSGATEGGTVADGGVVWTYKSILSGGGVPVGTILPYSGTGDTPPYGFLFFEGQAVSRTMYADYFNLVGTTYGEGDGETTFNLPNLIEAAMLNGSYTKTSYTTAGSATFAAPKAGWYKITVKGGGGGGAAGNGFTGNTQGGGGGGEGGTTIGYEKMTAGDTATVVVGAGGSGGLSAAAAGAAGGDSSVTVNSNTYTGGGGAGGVNSSNGGAGGTGTIYGAPGGSGCLNTDSNAGVVCGGAGGGAGGGTSTRLDGSTAGVNGGGGGGGSSYATKQAGSAGGDGYVTFEYIGVSMKYIGKVYDGPTPSSAGIDLTQYAQDLANKADRSLSNLNATGEARLSHVVVDSYYDSTTGDWWREYADGWLEQGGFTPTVTVPSAGQVGGTVTFLKPMADTKYFASLNGIGAIYGTINAETTTGCTIFFKNTNNVGALTISRQWFVAGMGANS